MVWLAWILLPLCAVVWAQLQARKNEIMRQGNPTPIEIADRYGKIIAGVPSPVTSAYRRAVWLQLLLMLLSVILVVVIFSTQGWILGLVSVIVWFAMGVVSSLFRW